MRTRCDELYGQRQKKKKKEREPVKMVICVMENA